MLLMFRTSLAVIAIAFCPVVSAQQPIEKAVIVTVEDQSGALIPGAHINAIEQSKNQRSGAIANQSGQAELHLPQGNDTLNVWAPGFMAWQKTNFALNPSAQITVTMSVSSNPVPECGPCVSLLSLQPDIPTEILTINAEIPYVPVELLVLHPKRFHTRHHALFGAE